MLRKIRHDTYRHDIKMLGPKNEGVFERTGIKWKHTLTDNQKGKKKCGGGTLDTFKIKNPAPRGLCATCIKDTFSKEELKMYSKKIGLNLDHVNDKNEICQILMKHLDMDEMSFFDVLVNKGIQVFRTLILPSSTPTVPLMSSSTAPQLQRVEKYIPVLIIDGVKPIKIRVPPQYLLKESNAGVDTFNEAKEEIQSKLTDFWKSIFDKGGDRKVHALNPKTGEPFAQQLNLADLKDVFIEKNPALLSLKGADGNTGITAWVYNKSTNEPLGRIRIFIEKQLRAANVPTVVDQYVDEMAEAFLKFGLAPEKRRIDVFDGSERPASFMEKRFAPSSEKKWAVPGNRTITYNFADQTAQIDGGAPFPIVSIDTESAPNMIYIQATNDVGIFVGETMNPKMTIYKFKFLPGDSFVKFMPKVLGAPPMVLGEKYLYLLDRGKYISKDQKTLEPATRLQTGVL